MTREIVSRREAHARGLSKYYTGQRCKHGHDSFRYVRSGICTVCAKNYSTEARNAYLVRKCGGVRLRFNVPVWQELAVRNAVDMITATDPYHTGWEIAPLKVHILDLPALRQFSHALNMARELVGAQTVMMVDGSIKFFEHGDTSYNDNGNHEPTAASDTRTP